MDNENYVLPDILDHHLKLVFCGTAASNASAQKHAYYAGPGNRFWPTLYEVGITASHLEPKDFRKLLDLQIGLTDLAKHTSGTDDELSNTDFDVETLVSKIEMYSPSILAFTSKTAAKIFLERKNVDYGLLATRIDTTKLFVLPSPSGAARRYWDIQHWVDLATLLNKEKYHG